MWAKRIFDIALSSNDLIKYISNEESIKKSDNFIELKSSLVEKYKKLDVNKIKELQEEYKYKIIGLKATNPENLTIGALSIIAILATIFTVILSVFYKDDQVAKTILTISYVIISFILATLVLMFILGYRIKNKANKTVYYQIMDEVLIEVLKQKKSESKNNGFKEYQIKIKEIY